jgi:hypothetical protein
MYTLLFVSVLHLQYQPGVKKSTSPTPGASNFHIWASWNNQLYARRASKKKYPQFQQKASGWINKTLMLIKQHITYMNISRYANIDKFVNIRYFFLLARRAYSWLFQLAQMWKLLAPAIHIRCTQQFIFFESHKKSLKQLCTHYCLFQFCIYNINQGLKNPLARRPGLVISTFGLAYLLCSQFQQKASGWINKTLMLIKQHITYMNISSYANIDKFVNIQYFF